MVKGEILMDKGNFRGIFIKEEFFKEHSDFKKLLDLGDTAKQSRRSYIFLEIEYKNNKLFIPLRTNLGDPVRKFGVIGFSVPSKDKPLAGLDYRHILIINDSKYIEVPSEPRIPKSQRKIIDDNYNKIQSEAISYIEGYVKTAIKGREEKEPKYRESVLHNFHEELGVLAGKKERQEKLKSKKNNISKCSEKDAI